MEQNGIEWNRMEQNGIEWNGIEQNGMEWNEREWNGREWKGMEWNMFIFLLIITEHRAWDNMIQAILLLISPPRGD